MYDNLLFEIVYEVRFLTTPINKRRIEMDGKQDELVALSLICVIVALGLILVFYLIQIAVGILVVLGLHI